MTPGGPEVSPVQQDLAIVAATLMSVFGDFKMGKHALPPMIRTALAQSAFPYTVYAPRTYTIEGMHRHTLLQPIDASPADFEWFLDATMQRVRHSIAVVQPLSFYRKDVVETIHALLAAFNRGAGVSLPRLAFATTLAPLFRMAKILIEDGGMVGVDEAAFRAACDLYAANRVPDPDLVLSNNKPCVTYEVFGHVVDRATFELAAAAIKTEGIPGVRVGTFKMFPEPVWCLRWQGHTWQHNGGAVKATSKKFPAFAEWAASEARLLDFGLHNETLFKLQEQLRMVPAGTKHHHELLAKIAEAKGRRGPPFEAAPEVPDGSSDPIYFPLKRNEMK